MKINHPELPALNSTGALANNSFVAFDKVALELHLKKSTNESLIFVWSWDAADYLEIERELIDWEI